MPISDCLTYRHNGNTPGSVESEYGHESLVQNHSYPQHCFPTWHLSFIPNTILQVRNPLMKFADSMHCEPSIALLHCRERQC